MIPIDVEDTKPYVAGYLSYCDQEKLKLKLMIDSGASHGLFLDESSDSALYIPEKHISSSLGRGLGGVLRGKIARLKKFELGKRSWEDLIVTFPQENDLLDSLKSSSSFRHGSIGGEILNRFKVVFDFPGERIYLRKGRAFKKPFLYNMSGLTVKARGSRLNSFEIVEVRENSSGEKAGFKKGDIILSVNNIDAKNLSLSNIIAFFNSKENKKIRIRVKRGNDSYTNAFRLKNQI